MYQVIGTAVICPLWYLGYAFLSSKDDYLRSGRQVSLVAAKTMFVCTVLGYGLPTILIYLPWKDLVQHQNWLAFWQPSPIYPNILIWYLTITQNAPDADIIESDVPADVNSPRTETQQAKNEDVKYLKRLYIAAGLIGIATHVSVLYIGITSTDPRVSVASIFLPDKSKWKIDAAQGIHWIFQWDFWFCFLPSLLWCLLCVADVWRVGNERLTAAKYLMAGGYITLISVLAGPGAAMAAVWYWREDKMVQLEETKEKST